MNSQKLIQIADHNAWNQRVRRETGAVEQFTTQHDALAKAHSAQKPRQSANFWLNQSGNSLTQDYNSVVEDFLKHPKVLQYARLNSGQQETKEINSRMLDSTYVNASDPNSMRDQGQVRNAVYSFQVEQFKPRPKGDYYRQLVPKDKPSNNSFYSFGGKSTIKQVVKSEIVNPVLLSHADLHTNTKTKVNMLRTPNL